MSKKWLLATGLAVLLSLAALTGCSEAEEMMPDPSNGSVTTSSTTSTSKTSHSTSSTTGSTSRSDGLMGDNSTQSTNTTSSTITG